MQGEPFGKYRLIEQIGQGGMGEVWLATRAGVAGFAKTVVIKRLHTAMAERTRLAEMLIREAKISSTLQHANIVQIYELGEAEGRRFIAMEFVRGIDLYRLLYRAAVAAVEIPQEVCLFIIAEVLRGLDHAHRARGADGAPLGLIHHDVSPSNILLGVQGAVKIADFGVARARFSPEFGGGSFGALRGKLGYMSPEQVEGKAVDHRSDLFSVGTCLYEMLTRKRLFRGKTDVETLANVRASEIEPRLARHPELSESVKSILRRALSRPRDRRFQSARHFFDAIEAHLFERQSRSGARDVSALVNDLLSRPIVEPPQRSGTSTGSAWTLSGTGSGSFPVSGGSGLLSTRGGGPFSLTPGTSALVGVGPDGLVLDTGKRWQRSGRLRETELFIETGPQRFAGPFGVDNLRVMIIGRRVTPEQRVSIDGGTALSSRDVITHYQGLSEGWPDGEPTDLALFDRFTLGALLASYARARNTGRLVLVRGHGQARPEDASSGGSSGRDTRELWFSAGRIVRLGTSVPEDQLGRRLLAEGLINATQLEVAAARAGGGDLVIARQLVRLGFVSQLELGKAVARELERRFTELFRWVAGRSAFYLDEQLPQDGVRLDIDPLSHLPPAFRRSFTEAELMDYFARTGNLRVQFTSEGLDLAALKLPPQEMLVLEALRGPAVPVSELVARVSMGPGETERVLRLAFLAHQLGLLRAVAKLPDSW